jgi:eukaryotic-like serine/threonine-protein kinase
VTHSPNITYVVMEYIEGPTLADTIERHGALSPGAVLRTGIGIAEGLDAGLTQGLVHRDVKPANILITRQGTAKLVDFGLARAHDAAWRESRNPNRRASLVGTPAYMAPEQQDDSDTVSFSADIYALGVTLYHAAVGAPPFSAADSVSCMAMHRTRLAPAPEDVVPGFPEPLSRLLLWMLAKSPEARPRSYRVLIQEMTQLALKLDPKGMG